MSVEAAAIPAGFRMDAKGRLVHIDQIKAQDSLEDELVCELMAVAHGLSVRLHEFKADTFGKCDAFLDLLAQEYQAPRRGKKGNVTFTSFDGRQQVRVQVADQLTVGPTLQTAKDLLDAFILSKAEGADQDLRTLIEHAFRVNATGQVSVSNLLGLRKLDIQGDLWARAMEAIADAIRVVDTKSYARFYERPNADSDWTAIPLDIAKV